MADDLKLSDARTNSVVSTGNEAPKDKESPTDEMMKRLPSASAPSDDEAEGEGDGTLDKA